MVARATSNYYDRRSLTTIQHLVFSWNVLALWNSMFGRQDTTTSHRFYLPRAKQLAQWTIHYGLIFAASDLVRDSV